MRILITGASGFIGSALVEAFSSEHEVVSLGRGRPKGGVEAGAHVSCDLSQPGALAAAIESGALPERIDAVVHMAVSRLHRGFPDTALDMFEINVAAAAHLLDYARAAGAGRVVLASTGTVYAGEEADLLREDLRLRPTAYFPASKLAAELLAESYRGVFDVAILRYFAPFGPGQTDRLIPGLVNRVRSGAPVTLPPTGDGLRFAATYLDDCVEVARRAVCESWDGVVNVASPEALSIRTAAAAIGEVLGCEPRFERTGDAPSHALIPNLDALRARMSTDHFTDFKSGVRAMVDAEAHA